MITSGTVSLPASFEYLPPRVKVEKGVEISRIVSAQSVVI